MFATSGPVSLTRLALGLASAAASKRDGTAILHRWLRVEVDRHGRGAFYAGVGPRRLLVVVDPAIAAELFAPEPAGNGFAAGALKTAGMRYLAPLALTISNDDAWRRRRRLNEAALAPAPGAAGLAAVDEAFATPVRSVADLRRRMGRVMNVVVFGGAAPPELAGEVDAMKRIVDSPVRRALGGRRHRPRVEWIHERLWRLWEAAPDHSLVGHARRHAAATPEAIEQLPHWIFTFTGSATDLLVKTLAVAGSRPPAVARLRSAADSGFGVACLREGGRLYAPVARTFHRTPAGASLDGTPVPPGTEIVTYLPLHQRDRSRDPTADEFNPDRWLGTAAASSLERYPYLFLAGSRTCPGEDLILPLLERALLLQTRQGAVVSASALQADPLPLAFPWSRLRFTVRPGSA
jgi:cytochrome P450